jgi:cysteinyl-tRNA synthetase
MTMKLFLLMAHYRSTVDFSNEALLAAEKGYERLTESLQRLDEIQASTVGEVDVEDWKNNLYNVMNDDLNTPKAVALMFDAVRWINAASSSKLKISVADLELLKATFKTFYFDILGLEKQESSYDSKEQDLVKLLLSLRNSAKEKKDYETADRIRNELNELGIEIMDSKEGTNFKLKR